MTKNPENQEDKDGMAQEAAEAAADKPESEAENAAEATDADADEVVEMEAYEVEAEPQAEASPNDEAATEAAVEAPEEQPAAEAVSDGDAQLAAMQAEQEALRAERDDYKDQVLRARAEFDNYRKRVLRDGEEQRKRAAEQLLRELLPVVDNLERALAHGEEGGGEHLVEGVKMVHKQFLGVLDNHGVTPIVAVGEPFDPNLHDAMTQQPSAEYAEGVVMEEFERGYLIGERVLRPSKVLVSSGAPENPGSEDTLVEDSETAASEEAK